jgi:hypothetical protein
MVINLPILYYELELTKVKIPDIKLIHMSYNETASHLSSDCITPCSAAPE